MKLTADHIGKLLKRKEDDRVEFKRATSELPDNLWETYSAFCNTDGGTILLGIREGKNKTYSIEGVSDARNTAIFNIFALVDIGERSGMGLANLHGLWKKYGYAEPKITESYDPDRTVLVVTTDDDTVNDTVKHPQIRTRTTPVQHPYNEPQFRTTTIPIQDTNEAGCRHDDGHAGRVTLPARKRLNHRGPLSVDEEFLVPNTIMLKHIMEAA